MNPKQVLHFQGRMGKGGAESFMMNMYRSIDRDKIQFNFLIYEDYVDVTDYHEEIKELGGKIYVVTNPKKNLFNYIKEVNQLLKNHSFDIVHNQVYFGGGINLWLAKKNGIKKRVAHSHATSDGKSTSFLMNILRAFLHKLLLNNATDFVAVSKEAGQSLFDKQEYVIVHNGIDLSLYQRDENARATLRNKLGIKPDDFVVGNIGRLEKQKNQLLLLNIIKAMKKHTPTIKLVLIGNGSLKDRLMEKIEEEGIKDNVLYLGERDDIPKLLNIMDVFVMTSLYEGLPMVCVEAQANQKKLVLSDTISKDTQLTPNVTFVPLEAPVESWEKAIESGDTNNELTDKLQTYDVSYTVKQMVDIYLSNN